MDRRQFIVAATAITLGSKNFDPPNRLSFRLGWVSFDAERQSIWIWRLSVSVWVRQHDRSGGWCDRRLVPSSNLRSRLSAVGICTEYEDFPLYPSLVGEVVQVPNLRRRLECAASRAIDGQTELWFDPEPDQWRDFVVPSSPPSFGDMLADVV